MHRGEQRVRNPLVLRHAIEPRLILERLERREKGIEDDFLRHDADRIFGVARIGVDVEAPDARVPAGLVDEPREDVDQRRLARAIGAEQSRSEEHTSELQSLMRISYAVFCLKKK